jgi:hypothetical protein
MKNLDVIQTYNNFEREADKYFGSLGFIICWHPRTLDPNTCSIWKRGCDYKKRVEFEIQNNGNISILKVGDYEDDAIRLKDELEKWLQREVGGENV